MKMLKVRRSPIISSGEQEKESCSTKEERQEQFILMAKADSSSSSEDLTWTMRLIFPMINNLLNVRRCQEELEKLANKYKLVKKTNSNVKKDSLSLTEKLENPLYS